MDEDRFIIEDTYAKMGAVLSEYDPSKVMVSYSGGSDSDIVMHLLRNSGHNVKSVFYDTGIEYQATKDHIQYMISQGFEIDTIKASIPVPVSNLRYGHPFISKMVSDTISRLQKHGFDFRVEGRKSFQELLLMFPKSKAALRWWCNEFGENSQFNISQHKYLKEFLIEYGLPFKVSGMCCDGAKKKPSKKYFAEKGIDLVIMGIRKSEGGARSSAYKNCYVQESHYPYSMYFPLFWWKNGTKELYESEHNVIHSKCYTEYGLKRTGCAGCPFNKHFDQELESIEKYEPKLTKGISNIFQPSYEWTRKYREYVRSRK
jgi:3'-phosphoadenosine 5'-phosphosulfate sulfotransferase (PAPS reductase)/FAD synthetase